MSFGSAEKGQLRDLALRLAPIIGRETVALKAFPMPDAPAGITKEENWYRRHMQIGGDILVGGVQGQAKAEYDLVEALEHFVGALAHFAQARRGQWRVLP